MFTPEECIELNGSHEYGDTEETYGACVNCQSIHDCDKEWNFELNQFDDWECATCNQPCDRITIEEIEQVNEDYRRRDVDFREAALG